MLARQKEEWPMPCLGAGAVLLVNEGKQLVREHVDFTCRLNDQIVTFISQKIRWLVARPLPILQLLLKGSIVNVHRLVLEIVAQVRSFCVSLRDCTLRLLAACARLCDVSNLSTSDCLWLLLGSFRCKIDLLMQI